MLAFDPSCRRCDRLADFLDQVKVQYPDYYAAPVPAFGVSVPKLLIVGLAPGLHGANRTGRPFTGDHAGILLYRTLHDYGFASHGVSESVDDGLTLIDCRITNAVKCLPPQNKPTGPEVNCCNQFLKQELDDLPDGAVVLALGSVAHTAILKAYALRAKDFSFKHAAMHTLPPPSVGSSSVLLDSYHCSRYNTQTKRLTEPMFRDVFAKARHWIEQH